jgi:hypothetical protein
VQASPVYTDPTLPTVCPQNLGAGLTSLHRPYTAMHRLFFGLPSNGLCQHSGTASLNTKRPAYPGHLRNYCSLQSVTTRSFRCDVVHCTGLGFKPPWIVSGNTVNDHEGHYAPPPFIMVAREWEGLGEWSLPCSIHWISHDHVTVVQSLLQRISPLTVRTFSCIYLCFVYSTMLKGSMNEMKRKLNHQWHC